MSRKLEKLISDNRNEFDDANPSDKVWQNLAESFDKKSTKKLIFAPFLKWSIAAAVLITAGTATFLFLKKPDTISESIASVKPDSTTDISSFAPEYGAELNDFAKLISLKQEELRALAPEQPELYNRFTTDINQLDSSYKSLKNQLSNTPNREMLLEAMIQNLQLQLNVLNQQLIIIKQIKQSKKVNHEKDNQTI